MGSGMLCVRGRQDLPHYVRQHCLHCVFPVLFRFSKLQFEPVHEISNNVVCATSKDSGQPANTHSLVRAFASRLSIL